MSWWSRGFSPSRFFLRGECFDTFPTCLTNNKKNWIYELNESLKEEMSLLYQPTNGYTSQLWALWDPCNPPQRCKHLSKTRETKNRLLTNPFWSSRSFFSHPSPCCFCFLHFQLWPVTYLHLRQARGTISRSRGASVACSVCVCAFFFSTGLFVEVELRYVSPSPRSRLRPHQRLFSWRWICLASHCSANSERG